MGDSPRQHDTDPREGRSAHHVSTALTSAGPARAGARSTLLDSPDERTRDSLRAAAVLIVFFELGYAAEQLYTSALTFDATLGLHLTNVVIGVGFFLSTFTAAIPRYWREIGLFVCISLLASASAICTASMRIEPLFVSVCVIVVGSGTLAPWDWQWQAVVSGVGIICFYVLAHRMGWPIPIRRCTGWD